MFTTGDDPVKEGLVASFNRADGNATGVNVVTVELETKRLGLLHEIVPTAGPIAALLNPKSPNFATQSQDVQAAGRAIGRQVYLLKASTEDEIDAAFVALAQQGIIALSVVAIHSLLTGVTNSWRLLCATAFLRYMNGANLPQPVA